MPLVVLYFECADRQCNCLKFVLQYTIEAKLLPADCSNYFRPMLLFLAGKLQVPMVKQLMIHRDLEVSAIR